MATTRTFTILYKLTDKDGYTRRGEDNEIKWSVGCTHTATGDGVLLCTGGVIHAYEHPLVGVLMNPVHANFDPETMRLWRCEGRIVAREGQLKCGVKSLAVLEELPVPTLTTEQRIKIVILCAKQVEPDPQWIFWADRWLSGEDRTEAAAWAAAGAAEAAAEAAARAAMAAGAASWAARAARASWAAEAAWAAEEAAKATGAAWAAEAAREAARASWEAARASWEAGAAARTAKINLIALIESVCA